MRRRIAAAALAASALAAGCGSAPATVSPPALLADARQVVNRTSAVHFDLTSENIPPAGTTLQGGQGDLARPDQLRGTFQVAVDGLPASVKLIEVGGKFYAELPFAGRYQVTDPAKFGLGDPAQLLNPDTGVSRLLTGLRDPKSSGEHRVAGEVLEEVSGTVPGTDVSGLLPDVDTTKAVVLVLGIDPTSHQVRQVEVTGPFASDTTESTYIVTLTNYGERVDVTAPSTGAPPASS
ncbi:MAG TPA: LppX_LprAFG lipoprotein [Acidimicrobiales bacterium]|nr:LppX_LprAFG lipoprotein [Acidimicrobiales bacterium]